MRSGSMWTWRSKAPRTSSRARRDGSVPRKERVLLGDRRRPLDVEARDGLHPPGLPLRALRLRPHDRLVVGREDEVAAAADLDAVPARLPRVEEERLLDRMLVRAGFDRHAVLE